MTAAIPSGPVPSGGYLTGGQYLTTALTVPCYYGFSCTGLNCSQCWKFYSSQAWLWGFDPRSQWRRTNPGVNPWNGQFEMLLAQVTA